LTQGDGSFVWLVPSKLYGIESIEAVLNCDKTLAIAADESTISRWKKWFSDFANHFVLIIVILKKKAVNLGEF